MRREDYNRCNELIDSMGGMELGSAELNQTVEEIMKICGVELEASEKFDPKKLGTQQPAITFQ